MSKLKPNENNQIGSASLDIFKVAFFIGFLPTFIAVLIDFSNSDTKFSSFSSVTNTLLPDSQIYINIIILYYLFYFIIIMYLGVCSHLNKKISSNILIICKFFNPVAETLIQLFGIVAGVLLLVAFFNICSNPKMFIGSLFSSIFMFILAIFALKTSRSILQHYEIPN